MLRIILFLATNFAIFLVISVMVKLFGLDAALSSNGMDLNLSGLLIISALVGMTGSFISLMLSKWMAKSSMGVSIIDQPSNQTEQWLVSIVRNQAKAAGIGMPEVGIFSSPQPNAFATGMSKNNALVAVSTGLLDRMTEDEVEAVLVTKSAMLPMVIW